MTDWLALAQTNRDRLFTLLEQMIRTESPTSDKPGNDRLGAALSAEFRALGARTKTHKQEEFGDHVVAAWPGQGPHALLIGHIDTVWPLGTLARMGYTEKGGRLFGPGVLDMKGGIAAGVTAMRMVREAGKWPSRPVRFLINSDEERGSPSSRPIVEAEAAGAAYVMVLEPGHGPSGAIRSRRKGVGEFSVKVTGKAAHAGVAPERGVSAILELAHQVLRIQSLAEPAAGATVNVGLLSGGSARNTVAAHAEALVDVRVPDANHARRVDEAMRALTPVLEGAVVNVNGGFHRPPMERTPATAELIGRIQAMATEMGIGLTEDRRLFGGGSDANITAAMRVPTVDGMGAIGDKPHAEGENIVAGQLVVRTALIAKAISEL